MTVTSDELNTYTSPPAEAKTPSRAQSTNDDGAAKALQAENARLSGELREARALIRDLELQVESMRANARKAAEALLAH
ncbi:hypothetical protein EWM64_g9314 [Hericium alpestre]|uniref:Uncharacterized protein n=1 Tax=Hericium alpestre TaxID=135208 RepID=A0A4Y9ZKW8_9AGAM|nr:hypothetical protein EWM64_g9314 [Hericium alpestre]